MGNKQCACLADEKGEDVTQALVPERAVEPVVVPEPSSTAPPEPTEETPKREESPKDAEPKVLGERVTEPLPSLPQGGRIFLYTLEKSVGMEKSLGIDVKHHKEMLEVVRIFPEGDVHRQNMQAEAQGIAAEKLLENDVVFKVNGVEGVDSRLVAECLASKTLVLTVARGMELDQVAAAAKAQATP